MRTIQIEQVDGWRKAISEKAVYVTKDTQGQLRVLTVHLSSPGLHRPVEQRKANILSALAMAPLSPQMERVSADPSLRGMDTLETSVQDGQLLVRFQYFRQLVSDKEVIG